MKLQPVASNFNLPEIEQKILKFWQENQILQKYLLKNKDSQRRFSFLDGPITANNPMGVHHAWGRTLKDLYQRYKNMQGFQERFQNGFDNQGLWVEVEVEKKLGFKNKKDIENYGIDEFIRLCKEHTLHFAQVQAEQSKRLGYFMDWDNSYYTLSDENNYAIWNFLKKCRENGWLYKGEDVVPWCPRCGTAISQHEILTGDYADLTHQAVYVKYPLLNKEKEYLLIWTTTPWTLPANVAVAVNPEIDYTRVRTRNDEILILAKSRLSVIDEQYEISGELKGEKLVGLKYGGAFDDLPIVKKNIKEHLLVSWKEGVLADEGTGLIHMSTGSGPEDYDLGKKIGLPVFPVIDEEGKYIDGYGGLSRKFVKGVAQEIIDTLFQRNFLYKTEDFTHRYPLCWRCKTELLFRLVDEWYISMKELRFQMMKVAKKIRWIPDFNLKLELDWLKNMEDWLISKKRYWGLSLPIWECSGCGNFEVIGSKEELEQKAVEGWQEFESHSPHRPWTDKVKIKCPNCQKIISRIPDVGNPWLDAGIVSFSTLKYFQDKNYWKQWFPADLVLESFPGQFKNWFYSLITMAAALENTNPFKTLLGYALVRDEKGREMHKSWGNAIEFNEAADKMGADLMRWMYARQDVETNLNFGYGLAEKIKKEFLLIFWNCCKFFIDYSLVDNVDIERIGLVKPENLSILDKWILSRLNRLVDFATKSLDDFNHVSAALAIESFVVNDFSTWYIRRSRDRVGPAAENNPDKISFYETSYWVFTALVRLMAPFMPFLTEEIYQNLVIRASDRKESIHLKDWPKVYSEYINGEIEGKMVLVRRVCSLGNAARKEAGIKTRQPLPKLKISSSAGGFSPAGEKIKNKKLKIDDKEFLDLIRDELNVKEIEFTDTMKEEPGWIIKAEGELQVSLSTEITPTLMQEGLLRDFMRQIQDKRKKAGLKPQDRIVVYYQGAQNQLQFLTKNREKILKEVIANDLILAGDEKFVLQDEVKLGGEKLLLKVSSEAGGFPPAGGKTEKV